MKILKRVIIAIAIIIAIPLIAALFIKKEYSVERQITILKPKQEVFDFIKYLKNQDLYSVWATADPNMKTSHTGIDATVGFESAWDSQDKNVGKGSQIITNIVEGERIDTKLRFIEPFESEDDAYLATEAIDENTTLVKWGFNGKFPYPLNIMRLFMNMEEMLGGDLEKGLENLKTLLESEPIVIEISE